MRPFSELLNTLGIDLGSSSIHIYHRDRIVLSEASVVAEDPLTHQILGFGTNALIRYHQSPGSVRLIRPIKHGVIDDYELAKALLVFFINKARKHAISKATIVVSTTSTISPVTRHALSDALLSSGAQKVYMIPSSAASAIGEGKDLTIPSASFSLVIGRDVTDAAIYSCGGVISKETLSWGGNQIDIGICQYLREKYNVMISKDAAERIKIDFMSYLSTKDEDFHVRGRRMNDGVEVVIPLTSKEMSLLMQKISHPVLVMIRNILQKVSPEMAGDLLKNGILLAGGTAKTKGISEWLQYETGLPVHVSKDVENVIAKGCYFALEQKENLSLIITEGDKVFGGKAL